MSCYLASQVLDKGLVSLEHVGPRTLPAPYGVTVCFRGRPHPEGRPVHSHGARGSAPSTGLAGARSPPTCRHSCWAPAKAPHAVPSWVQTWIQPTKAPESLPPTRSPGSARIHRDTSPAPDL